MTAPALLKKGLQELQRGEVQAAKADLQSASELDSKNPYVWTALTEVYLQAHEQAAAAGAATKAEATGRGNPIVDHGLAMYYAKTNQFSKAAVAEQGYAESGKADPEAKARAAAWYLAAGEKEKALPLAESAAKADPEAAYELAQLFLRAQDFTGAAELLQKALEEHPNDPRLTLAMGVARYGQRRFADAIKTFLQSIQLDPEMEQSYSFLGKMLDQAGPELPAIVSATSRWAHKVPDNAEAQLVLAKVLVAQDPACEQCESLLRRSIELNDGDWESHYQLGLVFAGRHQYPAAAAELKRATVLAPSQAMPHYHLARIYDRLGDHESAAAERALHKQLVGTPETR